MPLVSFIHGLEMVDLHIESLLVLAEVLHLAHETLAVDFVVLDQLKHHLNRLVLISVLRQS